MHKVTHKTRVFRPSFQVLLGGQGRKSVSSWERTHDFSQNVSGSLLSKALSWAAFNCWQYNSRKWGLGQRVRAEATGSEDVCGAPGLFTDSLLDPLLTSDVRHLTAEGCLSSDSRLGYRSDFLGFILIPIGDDFHTWIITGIEYLKSHLLKSVRILEQSRDSIRHLGTFQSLLGENIL